LACMIATILDITQRQRAEEKLRESEERWRLALSAGDMGVWEWDLPSGKITWSEEHARLFGLTPSSFGGTFEDFASCVHPEDLSRIREANERARALRLPDAQEFRVIWPDGSIHWIDSRGRFDYDAHGRAVRMRGVVRDVTQRKQAAEALQRAH